MTELPPIDIQWEAPAECPDVSAEIAAIERHLGRSLDPTRDGQVRARGRIRRADDGSWELRAVLEAGGHVETETLVAKRCQALGDAMALKIALAIDPSAPLGLPPPPATAQRDAEPRPAATPAPLPAKRLVHFAVRGMGGIGAGPLPGATPSVGVYASLQLPRWRFELGGEAHWSGVARYEELPTIGADTNAFIGGARGCVEPFSSPWAAAQLCAGVEAGALRAQGFGLETTTSATKPWGALLLAPALQFKLTPRLSLWVELDGLLTVLRPEFYVENLPTLYSPATGSFRGASGFEIIF